MLSILILSQKGEGKEIASKLITEGHIVKFWSAAPEGRDTSVYPWQTIDRYQEHIEATDLFVFTSSGIGGLAEELRKRRKVVVGGTIQELLVTDVDLRETALRLLGLPQVLPSQGTTISMCGWYDGKNWLTYLGQRYTRLMDGDRGPKLELGCLVANDVTSLPELTPILDTIGYRGFIGLDLVATSDGMYFEGFDMTLSSAKIPAMCEAARLPLSKILYAVGSQGYLGCRSEYGLSLKVLGMDDRATFHPPEQAEKHCWRTYEDFFLGYISAGGLTPQEARKRAYRTVANSVNQDAVYRRDIGCNSLFDVGDSDAVNQIRK